MTRQAVFLVDSAATSWNGHHLEYLLRISAELTGDTVILANKRFATAGAPLVRVEPVFRYATHERGRYWVGPSRLAVTLVQGNSSETSSPRPECEPVQVRVRGAMEAIFNRVARLMRPTAPLFMMIAKRSTQARQFQADLEEAIGHSSKGHVLLSTSNEREIAGLMVFLAGATQMQGSIVLRTQPFSPVRFVDIPLEFAFGIMRTSVIRLAASRARLVADTPELCDLYSQVAGTPVKEVFPPAIAEPLIQSQGTRLLTAPGNREETRIAFCRGGVDEQELSRFGLETFRSDISSSEYARELNDCKGIILPYDDWAYRFRSSGVAMEALSAGAVPVIPAGTSMSRLVSRLTQEREQSHFGAAELLAGQLRRGSGIRISAGLSWREVRIRYQGPRRVAIHTFVCSSLGSDVVRHDLSQRSWCDSFLVPPEVDFTLDFKGDTRDVAVTLLHFDTNSCGGMVFRPKWLKLMLHRMPDANLSFGVREYVRDHFSPSRLASELIG